MKSFDSPPGTRCHVGGRLTTWGRNSLQAQLWAPERPRPTLDVESSPSAMVPGPYMVAVGDEGAITPGPQRVDPLHSTFGAPGPLWSGDHSTAVQVPGGLFTQGSRTHIQESCLLSDHCTGLARIHCTPTGAGWAGVHVNIGWDLSPGIVGPSRPRSPVTGWSWGQQVVSKHRVVPRRTGAGSVLATWRVLLKGH